MVGEAVQIHTAELPKHKKNATLGFKTTTFGPVVMLEQEDAASLEKGEEVTLMDWGNAIIKSITRQGDNVTAIDIELNLKGDFKLTKKKLTWLAPTPVVDVVLIDYDYLITKKKLEQDDEFADFVTPKTEFKTLAVGDANLKGCKKGDIIQLERKGYFIVDKADGIEIYVILIPDGKVASLASKAAPASEITQAPSNKKTKQAKEGSKMNMYPVESIYSSHQPSGIVGKMYGVESVYGPVVQASAATNVIAPNPATPAMQEAAPSAKHKKDKKPKAPVVVEVEVPLVAKLNIRVGKILSVSKHPDADTLYVEKIDVGEAEPRTVVSGLVKYMQPEDLLNKDVLCVLNLKPASMRGVISHAMVLCASTADKVEFLVPPAGSLPGDKVFFKDNLGEPELMLNPKKKIWEKVQVDFKTDSDRVARWKDVAFETSRGIVHSASLVGAAIK